MLSGLELPSIVQGAGVSLLSVGSDPGFTDLSDVLDVSGSILSSEPHNNVVLDGSAAAQAWSAAGNDPDLVSTCGNLGDADTCRCPIK